MFHSRPNVRWLSLVAGLAVFPLAIAGQTPARVAASLQTILQYPGFFQGRTIALVATPAETETENAAAGFSRIPLPSPRALVVLPTSGRLPARLVEIRGTLVDVGQLSPDDSRISPAGLGAVIQSLSPNRWPERRQIYAIVGATWVDPPPADGKTVRAIVLSPGIYEGKSVTVRGRFRGQNLYGDLPAWPRQSQWDFVLQAADASVWVTGRRPRGRGFDLDPTIRRGAGTWLQVTGTVHISEGLPRIAAERIEAAAPVDEDESASASKLAPPPPEPPTIIFSAPREGATGVDPATLVRIQFSRDMKESSFPGRVRVAYSPETGTAPPAVNVVSRPLQRAIELRFASALAPDTLVVIEFAEGITAADGTALPPTKITFRTGR